MMAPCIFICFAKEDVRYRNFLAGQAKNRDVPFEFEDMSVQEPYDSKWKTRCREKIKWCHGFIALLRKKTWRAGGARWEMYCRVRSRVGTTNRVSRVIGGTSEYSDLYGTTCDPQRATESYKYAQIYTKNGWSQPFRRSALYANSIRACPTSRLFPF